jgi:hypothetical protein
VGFTIVLALGLIGCGHIRDDSMVINGDRWSKEDIDLLRAQEPVVPHYLILEGETEKEVTDRITDTLPQEYHNIVMLRSHMNGYAAKYYGQLLNVCFVVGARSTDYPESDYPELGVKEITEITEEQMKVSERAQKWFQEGIAKFPEQFRGDFYYLAKRNVVFTLAARERQRRYICSLSDREWDLLKLQIQKKQHDELIGEIKEQGEKNREQSAARSWISLWNAERIKTSIDQLNNTLRLNQPAYNYNYQR